LEYFCDLAKSMAILRAPKETAAAAPAGKPQPPRPAAPAPAPVIKPALEGAKPGVWTMDYEAAAKYSEEHNSLILMFFTGSDWNRQAKATTKALFARPGFDKYAIANNILLVWVDFPENASLVPEKYVEQNAQLRKLYVARESFPACVLLDDSGFAKLASFDKTLPTMTLRDLQEGIKPHLPKKSKK